MQTNPDLAIKKTKLKTAKHSVMNLKAIWKFTNFFPWFSPLVFHSGRGSAWAWKKQQKRIYSKAPGA